MRHLVDEQGRQADALFAEQRHVTGLHRARRHQPVAEGEQHLVVRAGVGVGDFGDPGRRDRRPGIVRQRAVQGALGGAGFGHWAHLRAHEVGAQEIVGDGEMAVAVALEQVEPGIDPEFGHDQRVFTPCRAR